MKKDITGLFCWVDDFTYLLTKRRGKYRTKTMAENPLGLPLSRIAKLF